MIYELVEYAKTNPMLVAGLSTVSMSAGMYLLRSAPKQVTSRITNSLVSQLYVSSDFSEYQAMEYFIWSHRFQWAFRNYEPSYDRSTFLSAGYGSGWGIWKGVLFSFTKSKEGKGYQLQKTLQISFYTRKISVVESFIEQATVHRREPHQRIYHGRSYWQRGADKPLRDLSTVFINDDIKQQIVDGIVWFQNNEDYYTKRGIPYKYTVMLWGVPGTGKTSLIHAVASHLNLDIRYVTSLDGLSDLVGSADAQRIQSVFVIEDIDTLAKLRRSSQSQGDDLVGSYDEDTDEIIAPPPEKKDEDSNKKTLHDTMNTLDGFLTPHGLITFITTNLLSELDAALKRPGRVDQLIEIGPLNLQAAKNMYRAFYSDAAMVFWTPALDDEYHPVIGAQLQQLFMNNNPTEALDNLSNYLSTHRE